MSITFYKIIHLLGVLFLFTGVGALCSFAMLGAEAKEGARKLAAIAHGVGMLLVLVGGFGMLAKLQLVDGWGLWVWLKLVIWLLLGASIVVIRKMGRAAGPLLFILPLLGALAAWAALYKP